ncbi:hypothetical protein LCGC14_1719090 [marine sediment metagenome]|uniref:Uncharacterized protein n=1 Tax=marine sediment metagenome TaxID=412755 RepID=A0A0F9KCT6_9ZZZZ
MDYKMNKMPYWMRWVYVRVLNGTPIEHLRFIIGNKGTWLSLDPTPHSDTNSISLQEYIDGLQNEI